MSIEQHRALVVIHLYFFNEAVNMKCAQLMMMYDYSYTAYKIYYTL